MADQVARGFSEMPYPWWTLGKGGDHLYCPAKEIVGWPVFFFLNVYGKRSLDLNWAFVELYYRESQKMFYVNDYLPWLEPQ